MRALTVAAQQGEWLDDNFVGDFGACDAGEALATSIDAEQVAQRAREFLYKPDGGALTHRCASSLRDSHQLARPPDVSYKLGVHLEQDPLLYTQGSEFLMPGPLGNLYQVPMNLKVRMLLQLQARKAFEIYRSVNFPRPPADFMVRASAPCAAGPSSGRACLPNAGARAERSVPSCAKGGDRRGRRRRG